MTISKAGTFVIVTGGDYSSYGIAALCRLLEDADVGSDSIAVLYQTYRTAVKGKRGKARLDFLPWLIQERCLLEELPYTEMQIN